MSATTATINTHFNMFEINHTLLTHGESIACISKQIEKSTENQLKNQQDLVYSTIHSRNTIACKTETNIDRSTKNSISRSEKLNILSRNIKQTI